MEGLSTIVVCPRSKDTMPWIVILLFKKITFCEENVGSYCYYFLSGLLKLAGRAWRLVTLQLAGWIFILSMWSSCMDCFYTWLKSDPNTNFQMWSSHRTVSRYTLHVCIGSNVCKKSTYVVHISDIKCLYFPDKMGKVTWIQILRCCMISYTAFVLFVYWDLHYLPHKKKNQIVT